MHNTNAVKESFAYTTIIPFGYILPAGQIYLKSF